MCVLAMDYGVTMHIPSTNVASLPQPCVGVPPQVRRVRGEVRIVGERGFGGGEGIFGLPLLQAIPCKLMGIKPLPSSFLMLENIAGKCKLNWTGL